MNKDKKPLSETHLKLAREAYDWDPDLFVSNSTKVKWICSKKHIWMATIHDRKSKSNKSGCPYCGNKKLLKGFNDLATVNPELAKEAFGWDPSEYVFGSTKKVDWKCSLGHIWSAQISTRNNYKRNCPYCKSRYLLSGFNDLQTKFPKIAVEANGWDPNKVMAHSNKKLNWKCEYGHEWISTVKDRTTHNQNCPKCANTGFDSTKKGYLYFLIHDSWQMYKIGITNSPKDRFQDHKSLGWELVEIRGPMDGYSTKELEQSILKFLKNNKVKLAPIQISGKFSGYTESWTIDSYKVNNLKELIDKAREAGY